MIDRIREVINYSQLSAAAFADTIGISRSGLTHLLTGRNQPSLDVAKKILAKYPEVSTEWLIMGMGEMMRPEAGTSSEATAPAPESETPVKEQPAENSKMMRQTDLFGEYENVDDFEEDVVDPRHPQSVENHTVEGESDVEPILVPQPLPSPEPTPTPSQPQVSRVRAKPISAPNKREKSLNNVAAPERKLQKIVFFYDDHSFEVYFN